MTESFSGIELTVEKLVPGGEAFARLPDGQPLFVRGAAPLDLIRLRRVERQRGRLWTEDYELVAPSRLRVVPECAWAASCGGCDAMHLSRAAELEQKRAMLIEALERVAGLSVEPLPFDVEGAHAGYRSRVRFHVGKQGKLGYFARSSHQLVEVASCVVADPRINQALALIRRQARRFPQALGGFSELELRAGNQAVIARFVAREGIRPIAAEPFLRALGKELAVAATEREASRLSERRELGPDTYVEIPADAFSQINVAVNERLVGAVVTGAKARGLASFCDLFAGVGNFALPLARAGLSGVMVERSPSAVRAAENAAAEQTLKGLRARSCDALRALTDLTTEGRQFELVVLDPPREGAREVVAGIARLSPRAVAYVACDPVTLSRDLKTLVASGLQVSSVQPFDMFPRTHHFETLVWLDRG